MVEIEIQKIRCPRIRLTIHRDCRSGQAKRLVIIDAVRT